MGVLDRSPSGELPARYTGEGVEMLPIPSEDKWLTAHAGHRGVLLQDEAGNVPNIRGRSYWLCLDHEVVVLAPRS